jgi:hypothetical protein
MLQGYVRSVVPCGAPGWAARARGSCSARASASSCWTRARIGAQRAELDASSEHTARIEREAQAEPAADRQAETPYDMEMDL